MAKAKAELDEADKRRYVEIHKHEKKLAELEKRKMIEQLARDKEERFGKKFDPVTLASTDVKKEANPFEDFKHFIKAAKTLIPSFREGDDCKNCFSTIKTILSNISKNSTEEKFRKVKSTNTTFIERVGRHNLAVKALLAIGFEEEGEFYINKNPDFDVFARVIAYLEEEIAKLD